MGDDSSRDNPDSLVQSIKNEWSLFWDSLAKDSKIQEDGETLGGNALKVMSVDDVKELTKSLSQSRRKLNQKLESLNKEIELNSVKLEALSRTGQNGEDTLRRMRELNEQGQKISHELAKLDETLKYARAHQEQIASLRQTS